MITWTNRADRGGTVRTRVVILAIATAVAATRRRRPAAVAVVASPVPPSPERLHLRLLVGDDSDLVVADQDARDEHVLAVLDAHLLRAG